MSIYANKATLSLLNMTHEMYRKNIEIRRITKTCAMLMMSGLSKNDISEKFVKKCLESQRSDGGFIGNTDTIRALKNSRFFARVFLSSIKYNSSFLLDKQKTSI